MTCEACSGTLVPDDPTHAALPRPGLATAGQIPLSEEFKRRYELIQLLGTGAMGAVYRARRRPNQLVAIKFLLHLESAAHLKRFELETQALVALSHPNVMAMLAHGTMAGHPYLVTELLEGGTLRARIQPGTRTAPRQVQTTLTQILNGLSACHTAGILHRDLKPENILFDAGGNAKICDLGLAKLYELDQAKLTATGVMVGTPLYMAPELFFGAPATPASDLYAIGLILHEMLYGSIPLSGNTLPELVARRRNGTLELPPADIPPPILELLRQLLEQDPAARPRSATDAIRLLNADARPPATRTPRRAAPAPTAGATPDPATAGPSITGSPLNLSSRESIILSAGLAWGLLWGWVGHGWLNPARPVERAPIASAPPVAPPDRSSPPADTASIASAPARTLEPSPPPRPVVRRSPAATVSAKASPVAAASPVGAVAPAGVLGTAPGTGAERRPANPLTGSASPGGVVPVVAVGARVDAGSVARSGATSGAEPGAERSPAIAVAGSASPAVAVPVAAEPGPARASASPGAGSAPGPEVAGAAVEPERVVESSIALPFEGIVQRVEFPVLEVRGRGRALAFALREEPGVEAGHRVLVHASILPAPDLDVVMAGRVRVLASRRAPAPRIYWLSIGDADQGTVRFLMRGKAEMASWSGGATGAMHIIERVEREKRLWEIGFAEELARVARLIDSWTRTDSGACLVVDRVEGR